MRRFLGIAVILGIALPLAAADEKQDSKQLNGTYRVKSVSFEGKNIDQKKEGETTFTFKDGKLTVKEGTRPEEMNDYTVDASKTPHQIDVTNPKNAKDSMYGVYELKKGDQGMELTMVLARTKEDRPKDLVGKGAVMVVKLLRTKE